MSSLTKKISWQDRLANSSKTVWGFDLFDIREMLNISERLIGDIREIIFKIMNWCWWRWSKRSLKSWPHPLRCHALITCARTFYVREERTHQERVGLVPPLYILRVESDHRLWLWTIIGCNSSNWERYDIIILA